MAASAGAAFEDSIASYDIHARRQFDLEQLRAQAAREDEQRRIAARTLGAPDNQDVYQRLAALAQSRAVSRQAAPLAAIAGSPAPASSTLKAMLATNQPPQGGPQQSLHALSRGEPLTSDDAREDAALSGASPEEVALAGLTPQQVASIGATDEQDTPLQEIAAGPNDAVTMKEGEIGQLPPVEVIGKRPQTAGAPSLQDMFATSQSVKPTETPPAPPQKVPSAPELQTLAQVAPVLGDREVKDMFKDLIHQSGTDFNQADRLTEYAKAVARVSPESSIKALEQASVLRNRAWDNEEKLLKTADERFTHITELAETVVDQASLDRAHMIAGARGFDSSMFPNDFETAKPLLAQMVQSVQKSKEKIDQVLKTRRMDIDEKNAANRAEVNDATARLRDAQAAKAQSETGVKAKEAEIKQQKVDNQKEVALLKAEQKDREDSQKELDKAVSQVDKKARLVTSILSPYINQSKGAKQLADGVRASVNYMTDLQADPAAETPAKDLTLIHTFVDSITDVKSRGSIREIDAVRNLEGMPTTILKHFNKVIEGQTLLDYERKEVYDAMLERFRPINDSQIALEESYKKRLVDAGLPLDYFIQYSVPEATAAMGAGRNSPNPVSANTEAAPQEFKFRLDPAAPESDNLAKINSIRDPDERKAVMEDYRKLKSKKGGADSFPIPSLEAIEYVKKHPEKTKEFVDHYGPNALTKGK